MLKPLRDTLIIRTHSEEVVTSSGIVLPESAQNEWTSKGEVLAAGPGRRDKAGLNPVDVKVGDTVYFARGEGQPAGDKGEITLPETHVLAVLDGGEAIPYWDKVLVRLDKVEGSSLHGVVLPSSVEEGYDYGTVVAVGPGFPTNGSRQTPDLKAGDRVIFSQYEGMELDLGFDDTRRLFIVRENTVFATITEKKS